MRPIELVLEGFRSYDQRTVFNWRERQLVGIVGPIGSGKSSILDAITFALYGKTPVFERENKTLIREGRDGARVELAFGVAGQIWRVLRVIRRRGASQHALYRVSELGPSLECDREKEVSRRIEALLGLDFQAFCRSVLLAQNRFAEFLHASPSDQDKVLKGVFGFDRLDQMHRLAKERRHESELESRELQGRLRHVEEDRARLATAEEDLRCAVEQSQRLEAAVERTQQLESRASEADRAAQEAEARLRELERIAQQLPPQEELARQFNQLENAALKQKEAEECWQQARQRVEQAEEDHRTTVAETGSGEELAAAEQEMANLERFREQLARLGQSGAEVSSEVDERRAELERAQGKVERAEAARDAAAAGVEAATRTLDDTRAKLAAAAAASGGQAGLKQARQQLERLMTARQEGQRQQGIASECAARLLAAEDALEIVRLSWQAAAATEDAARQRVKLDREWAARAEEAFKYAQREDMALALIDQLQFEQPCPVCDQIVQEMPTFRLAAALEEAEAHRQQARDKQAESEDQLLESSAAAAGRRQALENAEERLEEARRGCEEAHLHLGDSEHVCAELEAELERLLDSEPAGDGRGEDGEEGEGNSATSDGGEVDGEEADFESRIAKAEERLARLEPRAREGEEALRQAEMTLKDALHATELAAQRERTASQALSAATDKQSQVEIALREASDAVAESQKKLTDQLGEGEPQTCLDQARERLERADRALEEARQNEKECSRSVEQARLEAETVRGEQERLLRQLSSWAGQLGLEFSEPSAALTARELEHMIRQSWRTARLQAEKDSAAAQQQAEDATKKRADLWRQLELDPEFSFERALAEAHSGRDRAAATVEDLGKRLAHAAKAEHRFDEVQRRQKLFQQLSEDLTTSRFLRYLLNEERAALAALGSERFEMLSGGRYRFSEDGTFAVVDLANAEAVRKSETLSGGESFLASLALALALAEKVTGGGGRLDAFFLDEGFGSLDPEHFDLAMEGIERLVTDSPERLVTVVSHVPEMRQRIEDLIVLDKDPQDGSTIVRQGSGSAVDG